MSWPLSMQTSVMWGVVAALVCAAPPASAGEGAESSPSGDAVDAPASAGEGAESSPSGDAVDSPASAPQVLRIAMRDFDVAGVDARTARLVQSAVLQELRKLDGVSVVSFEEVRVLMQAEAERASAGCEDDSCMAEIASALGADIMLVGGLAKVSGDHFFTVKRISQTDARVEGQVSKRLTAQDGEEFLAAVGPVVEELFPDRAVRAGQTRGVAEEVALRLNPPPLRPWAFWTLTGVSASAAAVSLAGWAIYGTSAAQLNAHMDTAKTTTVSFQRAQDLELQGNVGLAVGAGAASVALGVGVGAAVSAMLVDWHGYGEQQE